MLPLHRGTVYFKDTVKNQWHNTNVIINNLTIPLMSQVLDSKNTCFTTEISAILFKLSALHLVLLLNVTK